MQNRRYWDTAPSGSPIVPSRTSILETLRDVVANPPKISPKSTTGKLESAFFHVRGASTGHPWISLGLMVGIMVGMALWGKGRIRRAKGVGGTSGGLFPQLDGKEGLLSGGGANGKVD